MASASETAAPIDWPRAQRPQSRRLRCRVSRRLASSGRQRRRRPGVAHHALILRIQGPRPQRRRFLRRPVGQRLGASAQHAQGPIGFTRRRPDPYVRARPAGGAAHPGGRSSPDANGHHDPQPSATSSPAARSPLYSTPPLPHSQLAMTLHRSPTPSPHSSPSRHPLPLLPSFNSLSSLSSQPHPSTSTPPSTTPPSPTHLLPLPAFAAPPGLPGGSRKSRAARSGVRLFLESQGGKRPRGPSRAAGVFASRDERLRDEQIETNTLRRTPQTRYRAPRTSSAGCRMDAGQSTRRTAAGRPAAARGVTNRRPRGGLLGKSGSRRTAAFERLCRFGAKTDRAFTTVSRRLPMLPGYQPGSPD